MQTTLENFVPGTALDEVILTLGCGHTFTVETLDGHCELSRFYELSKDGRQWCGLATPALGFQGALVCPSCRSPITIPRYGRIFKRSALDVAERNVASDMSRSLDKVKMTMQEFDQSRAQAAMTQSVIQGTAGSTNVSPIEIQRVHDKLLRDITNHPVAVESRFFVLGVKRNKNVHHVPPSITGAWRTIARPLTSAYAIVAEIASRRPAHTVAYQNAFSTLYNQEIGEAAKDPAHAPRRPTEHAMRIARLKLGPPPRADKRFCVEALWLSIKLRFSMGELAEHRLDDMQEDSNSSTADRFVWAGFVRFIYSSCCRDIKLALKTATESESHRQVATSRLLELRAQFEEHRFNVRMRRQQPLNTKERHALWEETQCRVQNADQLVEDARKEYLWARRGVSEVTWIATHLTEPASKVLDQWRALEGSIKAGTFYQGVSLDEKTQIVNSFQFTHTGHWYACQNGHAFVIGCVGRYVGDVLALTNYLLTDL